MVFSYSLRAVVVLLIQKKNKLVISESDENDQITIYLKYKQKNQISLNIKINYPTFKCQYIPKNDHH